MRHPRVEKAVEAFDQPDDLDAELIRAHDRAVNSRVECRRISTGSKNANPFHASLGVLLQPRQRLVVAAALQVVGELRINGWSKLRLQGGHALGDCFQPVQMRLW